MATLTRRLGGNPNRKHNMSSEIETLRQSMRAAQVYGKGQYFEAGLYGLQVQKVFYKRTLIDGTAKENIIAEFTVIESNDPTIIGSSRSSVFSFAHKGWLPRFKALLLGLIGVDQDGKISDAANEAVEDIYIALRSDEERVKLGFPPNFLTGKYIRAEAMPGVSQMGKPVTNMKWIPWAGPAAA